MAVTVQCGACSKKFQAPEQYAGKKAKCPAGGVVEAETEDFRPALEEALGEIEPPGFFASCFSIIDGIFIRIAFFSAYKFGSGKGGDDSRRRLAERCDATPVAVRRDIAATGWPGRPVRRGRRGSCRRAAGRPGIVSRSRRQAGLRPSTRQAGTRRCRPPTSR